MPTDPGQIDPRSLDDTVADEVVSPEEAEAPPARPVAPRPPMEHRAAADQPPEEPSLPPAPPPRKPRPDPNQKWRPDQLSETVAEAPALAGGSRGRAGDDVDLNRIFDRMGHLEEAPLDRYDPEAGRTNVAVKISAATEAVAAAVKGVASSAVTTPFGRLVLSILVCLAGIGLVIAAVTLRDTWLIVAAAVVAPVGLLLVYWRYQAWLGHKRYMYRLLETLGEDVSEFDPAKVYRRTRSRAVRKSGR